MIERYIERINVGSDVDETRETLVKEHYDEELSNNVKKKSFEEVEIIRFFQNALGDGFIKTTGTYIDRILSLVLHFT